MTARVLVIAGSDSGGGAGIQADIKTITMLGAYAATAVTAVTVQNTCGVTAIHPVPPALVGAQIEAVLSDIGADAVKIGMLGDESTIAAVAEGLAGTALPIILDPVMVAKGGAPLLAPAAIGALRSRLLPLAALVTPNLPELALLTGAEIGSAEGLQAAAGRLLESGVAAVLAKGGHLPGDDLTDWLLTRHGAEAFRGERIATRHTHGTGCTMASAVAAGIAQGMDLSAAVARAHAFVRAAILAAPGFGEGHGPLGHHAVRNLA